MSGASDFGGLASVLYKSGGATPNLPPSPPSNLSMYRSGDQVTFSWASAADDHSLTPVPVRQLAR